MEKTKSVSTVVSGVANDPIAGAPNMDEKKHHLNSPLGIPETALSIGMASITNGEHHVYSYTSVGNDKGEAPGGYPNKVATSVIRETATIATNGSADCSPSDLAGSNSPDPNKQRKWKARPLPTEPKHDM